MLILSAYSSGDFSGDPGQCAFGLRCFPDFFVLYHAAQSGYGFQYLWPKPDIPAAENVFPGSIFFLRLPVPRFS